MPMTQDKVQSPVPAQSPFSDAALQGNQLGLGGSLLQSVRSVLGFQRKDSTAHGPPDRPCGGRSPDQAMPSHPHILKGELDGQDEGEPTIATRPKLQETKSMIHRVVHEFPDPPPWTEQITLRSIFLGTILGCGFSLVMMKLNLTAGIVPGMGMPCTLLGFFLLTGWNKIVGRLGFRVRPFTAQENTMMQTFAGCIMGASIGGGFASYLTAMDYQSYLNLVGTPGNRIEDVFNPTLRRTIPYHIAMSFVGCFLLVQLRKPFILDYQLPYPSATAGAVLINSLHSSSGEASAKAQVSVLAKWGVFSFMWTSFKWFFSSLDGAGCSGGFDHFPSFGLQALKWQFNFDFQQTYVGVGMICPHAVNISMLVGAIFSWGFMWPLIASKEGDWFPQGLKKRSFSGLFGYQVFLALAVFMGDGLYNLIKVTVISTKAYMAKRAARSQLPSSNTARDAVMSDLRSLFRLPAKASFGSRLLGSLPFTSSQSSLRVGRPADAAPPSPFDSTRGGKEEAADNSSCSSESEEELDEAAALNQRRNAIFLKDSIPDWVGWAGYAVFGVLGAIIIPLIYPPCKWYFVVVAYLIVPAICYVNAYVCGLTDNDISSMYGKLFIFAFAAWAGYGSGGVIVGLAICGVVLSTTSSTAGMMSDFRASWITLTSPRAMFSAQIIGTALGVVIGPSIFFIFYRAFPIGDPNGMFPAPYATIYRAMAILGTQGLNALPKHCTQLFAGFFFAAIVMSMSRDFLPARFAKFVPIPSAFAIPFYLGPSYAVDMFIGTLVKWYWERINPDAAQEFLTPAAAGLIVGDGLVALPANALALAHIEPPICIKFVAAGAASKARRLLSVLLTR